MNKLILHSRMDEEGNQIIMETNPCIGTAVHATNRSKHKLGPELRSGCFFI